MISYKDDDLWQAVGQRDIAGVRRALAAGGDVNMVCGDVWVRDEVAGKRGTGRSLLHHAAWAGDLEIFKVLVAAGANCGRRRTTAWRPNGGVQGRGAGRELGLTQATPLHHAVMYKRQDIVEYLLTECRVDVDEPGEQGYTALHLAAKFDYSNIAELLLRAGARTDLITRDEKTVWDFAKGQQDRSSHAQEGAVKRLLEQYDAGGSRRDRALPMASRARSTVRQSKLFRMYESGNAAKAILGQDSLQWNVNLKEGAYHGRVFDAYEGHSSCAAGAADGREARKGGRGPDAPSLWRTTAGAYGAG
eukprot:TRINITY_DN27700_c0_g1_i1.p1 TRINITY_DN27700_c0_g1~~TRINITY_DN27700_c0_g1_i1.p1  ORF type:complete len:311 (+),score=55.15 TRINITY_DN27700_c0_g1_i1:23-934(+)